MTRIVRISALTAVAAAAALALSACGPDNPTAAPSTSPGPSASAGVTAAPKVSAAMVALSVADLPKWKVGKAATTGDLISVCGKPLGVATLTSAHAASALRTPNGIDVVVRVSAVAPGQAQAAIGVAQTALTNCPLDAVKGLTTSASLTFSDTITPGIGVALLTTDAAGTNAGSRGYFIASASPDLIVEVEVIGNVVSTGDQNALTTFSEAVTLAALAKTHGKPSPVPAYPALVTATGTAPGVTLPSGPAQTIAPGVGGETGPGSNPGGTGTGSGSAGSGNSSGVGGESGPGTSYGNGPVGGDLAPAPK